MHPIEILRRWRRLHVVGASATPGKDAHEVPRFLAERGYDVVPINPHAREVFGRPAYPALADAPGPFEIVAVFRPGPEAPGHVRVALELGARAIWLPTEVESAEARALAEASGVPFVENVCLRTVHRLAYGPRNRE